MSSKESRLTPTSMPSSLDYASDGQYDTFAERPPTSRKPSKQLQHSPAGRSNGLLGKMFRKGPSKHPKLNPVGISSKDFFSADQPPLDTQLPPSKEHDLSTKGNRLTRMMSSSHMPAITPSLTASPQFLTPKSTIIPAFSSSAAVSSLGCLSDSDTVDDSAHSASAITRTTNSSRCLTHQQQQRLERSLPQISRSAGYEVHCDSFGTADQPQRRRPSRLKLDAVHISGRSSTTPEVQSPRSHDSAASTHFSPSLHQHQHQPHTDDTSSPRGPAAVSPSALLAMYADAERGLSAGESRKRGALWRAKLSFTNLRRPDSRRQRHQSFDSNSVDIAAHSRMYAESPLVSVPSTAPASARSRSPGTADYEQHKLEEFLGMSASPRHSRFAQSPAMSGSGYCGTSELNRVELDSVGDLGTIDKDFLLTIQRNSALEARRQRRRETRRNTMSFLSSANMSSPPHESDSLVPVVPIEVDSPTLERTLISRPASPPSSAGKLRPRQSHTRDLGSASRQDHRVPCDEIGRQDISTICVAGETVGHDARCVGGLEGSNGEGSTASEMASPSEPRPTSLDSLTYSEQAVSSSSRPSSNGCGGKQSQVPDNRCSDNRLQMAEPVVWQLAATYRPPPPDALELSSVAISDAPSIDVPWSPSHSNAAARAHYSSNRADSESCVPPVPPLPTHIALIAHQRSTTDSGAQPDLSVRPVTANARGSPRFVTDTRRYRGSASVLPTAVDLAPPPLRSLNSPVDAALATSGWDAEAIRLQRYRMTPCSGRRFPDTATNNYAPVTVSQSSTNSGSTLVVEQSLEGQFEPQVGTAKHSSPPHPMSAHFGRKFSQPDTQLDAMSRPSDSLVQSPGILSKSTPHINIRGSVDGNKPSTKGNAGNGSCSKHGIGRLFSATPPSRKSHLAPHHLSTSPITAPHQHQQLQPPTSPTVSSLVGDPMARRKIRDQLASSQAFDRLLEEDDEFTMAISLTPSVAGMLPATAPSRRI
ncbi:hypothetical protein GGH93_001387 [Coemansia aciculifera]|nr:hypothetical protein GGH93_001387 [Coemansia aciculifera]